MESFFAGVVLGLWEFGQGTPPVDKFRIQPMMSKFRRTVLIAPLLFATAIVPAFAQHNDSAYYNGMRSGGHGGNYYNSHDSHYHDDHRQPPKQGGIGPGKGALIGGASGAALGAVFGGGLKGTLIGGAAGAGIGAVVGQAAQNKRENDNYHRPY
jgi:hypothetical protein